MIDNNEGTILMKDRNVVKEDNKNIPLNILLDDRTIEPIYINSDDEFLNAKFKILNAYYLCLYAAGKKLTMVTENGHYFIVNLESVSTELISKTLIFRKPKKILFDIKSYAYLFREETTNVWDISFLLNILFGIKVNNPRDLQGILNIDNKYIANNYLIQLNLINLAKALNIYVERNKLNKLVFLELDILKHALLIGEKGFPIDLDSYTEYKNEISERYNKLINSMSDKYGKDIDFYKIDTLFEYLINNKKVVSLEDSILEEQSKELYDDLTLFQTFNELKKHRIVGSRFPMNYNVFDKSYQISAYPIPESIYFDKNVSVAKGEYADLYYRVLAEITKNKDLIKATSSNKLIEYISNEILKNKNLGIYTDIFIKSYANNKFKVKEIEMFAKREYKTIINIDDISKINKLFEDRAPGLMDFFKKFDATNIEFERYSKSIFNKNVNLDGFIRQIVNLIFINSINYVMAAVNDYNKKYTNDGVGIEIGTFFENTIYLIVDKDCISVAIDILNRYMALGYKKIIKNTKYYIVTEEIKS